jgi:3-deoxy-manno-octulosonate cytidylyltransferase (CMP-KDO synthetase)
MASSRFPGKPMALIHGMPMIGHCYCRVRLCDALDDTYVATCDQEIYNYIESIGGKAIMTADTHERASDRAAEAMIQIEELTDEKVDILVMVQGDEPMDTPEMINESLAPMTQDETVQVVNLMGLIDNQGEFEDPNNVKVVVGPDSNAIYFSREPVPSRKKSSEDFPMLKQICVIPFRRDFLLEFNKTPETPLERVESVDMLRVIESGGDVRMVMTEYPSLSVDTPDDLETVEKVMIDDLLMKRYLKVKFLE